MFSNAAQESDHASLASSGPTRLTSTVPIAGWCKGCAIERNEVADPLEYDVSGRSRPGVLRVASLLRKDRRHPAAPCRLHRRKTAGLVVDEDIAPRRVEALDVFELLLLVD